MTNPITGKPLSGGITGAAEEVEQVATGGGGGGLTGVFGAGGIGQQLLIWGVLNQLLVGALAPAVSDIEQAANTADPVIPLTPEQLAVGQVRGIIDDGSAPGEAAKSGIGTGRFAQLVELAQQPVSLDLGIQAARRSLGQVGPGMAAGIDLDTYFADLGISEQYRPLLKAAVFVQPSAAEVLNAWLEGQIEADEAVARISATGLDPSWIQTAYNANGQAPTPTQALELLNRGIIPEDGTGPESVSYQQAFLEGPWRNKWLDVFKALRFYVPPPRTVTAMLKEGALTEAQATQYLKDSGLDDTLIAIYIAAAAHTTSVAQRELSQAQVVAAYEDKLITNAEATADLVALKYPASSAALLLALADKKQATAAAKSATTRIQTLYLSGKDDAATARAALASLGLNDDSITALLATWDLERTTTTRTLTEAQIVAAVYYAAMTTATGISRLVALGYDEQDANILIINRTHVLPAGWVAI